MIPSWVNTALIAALAITMLYHSICSWHKIHELEKGKADKRRAYGKRKKPTGPRLPIDNDPPSLREQGTLRQSDGEEPGDY